MTELTLRISLTDDQVRMLADAFTLNTQPQGNGEEKYYSPSQLARQFEIPERTMREYIKQFGQPLGPKGKYRATYKMTREFLEHKK